MSNPLLDAIIASANEATQQAMLNTAKSQSIMYLSLGAVIAASGPELSNAFLDAVESNVKSALQSQQSSDAVDQQCQAWLKILRDTTQHHLDS